MAWTSVKTKLPSKSDKYMVYCDSCIYVLPYSVKYKKWNVCDSFSAANADKVSIDTVTHWMPMPKPPKEE